MKEEKKNNVNYTGQYRDGVYILNEFKADATSDDLFERAKAYDLGIGVEVDKAKAARLYQQAMEAGDKRAKHNLAMMFISQEGETGTQEMGIRMLSELAEEGDANALYCLGGCYFDGKGVGQDVERGVELYKVASERGCAPATYALGAYYNNQLGDTEKGLEYIKRSAEEGFAMANFLLSDMYEKGAGVERDMEKSFAYLKRAAELGDAISQFKHGYLLLYVHHEFTEGVSWLRKAAAQGVEGPQEVLQSLGIETEMTIDERINMFLEVISGSDEEKAHEAYQKMEACLQLEDPLAQFLTGYGYYTGTLLEQDKDLGMYYLKQSASHDFINAISFISFILDKEERYEEANVYHRKAAEMGDHHAIHNLGNAYFYARGVEQSDEKAMQLWMKAASMGNTNSLCSIGTCYLRGRIFEQDINKGIDYLTKSAEQGNPLAMQRLAEVYRSLGDYQNAQYWEDMLHPN